MADEPKAPPPPKPPPVKPATPPAKQVAAGGAAKAEHKPPPAPAAPVAPPDPAPPADVPVPSYVTELQAAVPDGVTQLSYFVGDWTVIVPATRLLDVAQHLNAAGFDHCSDVTASDWPQRPQRFDVVYALYSVPNRQRVRLKVRAAGNEPVPSVTGIWPSANWLEREVYDLFGVAFTGHPDLRRILMPEDWQGHPQRKDYPLEGPGELLMESPLDWLKLKQAAREAEIE